VNLSDQGEQNPNTLRAAKSCRSPQFDAAFSGVSKIGTLGEDSKIYDRA
jgi:hypothetical protein